METTRAKVDYATASFITSNTLITAEHTVVRPRMIRKIRFTMPNSGKWIEFTKGEFAILRYPGHDGSYADMALIRLLNSSKLASLYAGYFELASFEDTSFKGEDIAHLTGYPCDKGTYNEGVADTLMEKSVQRSALISGKKGTTGYHLFTCTGDSGAPLWIEFQGKHYIVGIHHGGGGDCGMKDDYNCAMKLDDTAIQWIKVQLH